MSDDTRDNTSGENDAIDIYRTSCAKYEQLRRLKRSRAHTSPTTGEATSAMNFATSPAISRDSKPSPNNIGPSMARDLRLAQAGELVTQCYEALGMGNEEAIRNEKLNRAFRFSGLPSRHIEQSKLGIRTPDDWKSALGKVLKVILNDGIAALIGSPGTGKTQIAVEVAKAHLRASLAVKPIRYEMLADAFAICREAYGAAATRAEMAIIREFTSPGLLILDEIDKTAESDSEHRLLYRILNKRYEAMLPTLLIGNVADADALRVLLDRMNGDGIGPIFDRLRETGGIVELFGRSFRDHQGGTTNVPES